MCYNQKIYTVRLKSGEVRKFLCPCGKCVECEKSKASQWALRCLMEAEYYRLTYNRSSCVVTLTYSDDPGEVSKQDFQKFIKRLRSRLDYRGDDVGITYFGTGEYGELFGRPHYHVCIFGWSPDDLYPWKRSKKGSLQHRSLMLEELWPFGYVTVGNMSKESAFYCAKYLQKFLYDFDWYDFGDLELPFSLMSRKPMLGLRYLLEYSFVDSRGKFFFDGQYHSLPRTFYKYLTEDQVNDIMTYRYSKNASLLEDELYLQANNENYWLNKQRNLRKEEEYEIYREKAVVSLQQKQADP